MSPQAQVNYISLSNAAIQTKMAWLTGSMATAAKQYGGFDTPEYLAIKAKIKAEFDDWMARFKSDSAFKAAEKNKVLLDWTKTVNRYGQSAIAKSLKLFQEGKITNAQLNIEKKKVEQWMSGLTAAGNKGYVRASGVPRYITTYTIIDGGVSATGGWTVQGTSQVFETEAGAKAWAFDSYAARVATARGISGREFERYSLARKQSLVRNYEADIRAQPQAGWVRVTYFDQKRGSTYKDFGSQEAADKFVKEQKALQAELKRKYLHYKLPETKKMIQAKIQLNALEKMYKDGLVEETTTEEGNKVYTLNRPVTILTDKEIELASIAGFDIPKYNKGPSWILYEQAEGIFERHPNVAKDFPGLVEDIEKNAKFRAAMVGDFVDSTYGLYRQIAKLFKHEKSDYRKINTQTIKFLETDLTDRNKVSLAVGGMGARYLGSYLAFQPVGVVVAEVMNAARIMLGAGANALQVKALSREIMKNPKLLQAVTWAQGHGSTAKEWASKWGTRHKTSAKLLKQHGVTAAIWSVPTALELKRIYTDYKAGRPEEEIWAESAIRVGSMLGAAKGLAQGFAFDNRVRTWREVGFRSGKFDKGGLIPKEEIWTTEQIDLYNKGKYLTYKSGKPSDWPDEYLDAARFSTMEEYFGPLEETGMIRHWSSRDRWRVWSNVAFGEKMQIAAGPDSPWGDKFLGYKWDGMFFAPRALLRVPGAPGYTGEASARFALPGFEPRYGQIVLDSWVARMPEGKTWDELRKWMLTQTGKKTAYIPPSQIISKEMETIVPYGSYMVNIGKDYYTSLSGFYVGIDQYILLEGTNAQIQMGIKIAEELGLEVVPFGRVASGLPTSKVTSIITGIYIPTPDSTTGRLSSSDLRALSEIYGMSTSEINSLYSITTESMSSDQISESNIYTALSGVTSTPGEETTQVSTSGYDTSGYEPPTSEPPSPEYEPPTYEPPTSEPPTSGYEPPTYEPPSPTYEPPTSEPPTSGYEPPTSEPPSPEYEPLTYKPSTSEPPSPTISPPSTLIPPKLKPPKEPKPKEPEKYYVKYQYFMESEDFVVNARSEVEATRKTISKRKHMNLEIQAVVVEPR